MTGLRMVVQGNLFERRTLVFAKIAKLPIFVALLISLLATAGCVDRGATRADGLYIRR